MGSHCGHDHHDTGLSTVEIARALSAAEARCVDQGERMTAPRRRVLELLLQAGEAVKAYDLIARYGADGVAAKPPTVYRALEFLEKTGMAHRIASISAYVACSVGDRAHAAAFLICDCCGATEEVTPPEGEALTRAAETAGYVIEHTTIEAHGRCPVCRVSA
ncbi:Fur family transcriptional regulator [Brevundimonas sp. NIBR11]|uniref:Fur family transcriptional regulator n=1 Tax=Brevundimonas sp. NIBR11 TaxID=3015999 RepID=UPI0022F1438A|nr:Fur family transcriptional regulator [Brevundimonas sp. NIBR11]WGM32870.1 Zinc uptake regulation protein [Brevundimonas sp. NIBR11]